ncbi:hypothetical protein [Rubrivirga litoralis]|uniref:Lipoprotein n=1 Tax=Rubrivirga litoralis TaxID=3075598 RepID=A0ABU3BLZ2_9BACT|nr:hypothetical protein [Rubrivirga sp. F394]MDT0630309.1 hypothetical protein [Rubrivirga sp. F394]
MTPRPAPALPVHVGFVALLLLAGCAGVRPAPPESTGAGLVPVLRVEAGRADTLDAAPLGAGGAAAFGAHPDVQVAPADGTRVVVRPRAGWAGVALVPFRAGGADGVVAVVGGAPGLRLRFVGVDAGDPSLVEFALDQDGGGAPDLDEEEGVVALVGDRPFGDNAIDAFQDRVVLDLDAAGAGRQTVRLAARADGRVSNWVAIEVADGRFVREVRARVVGPPRP